MPVGVEMCVAIEDYEDELGELKREESVLVVDKLSRPGMYKVVKLRGDGSQGDEMWVPSKILKRKTSTAEVTMKGGTNTNIFTGSPKKIYNQTNKKSQ